MTSATDRSFWEDMFELATKMPRTQGPTKDFAKRSYPAQRVRFLTQNLRKPSTNTQDILSLRHIGIFAETIWVAIDHRDTTGASDFTHRIELRRFDKEDGHWEGWLLLAKAAREDEPLSTYPEDKNMSLEMGLQLIRDTENLEQAPRIRRSTRRPQRRWSE